MVPSPLGGSPPSSDQITSYGENRGPNRARSASQGPSQSLGTGALTWVGIGPLARDKGPKLTQVRAVDSAHSRASVDPNSERALECSSICLCLRAGLHRSMHN